MQKHNNSILKIASLAVSSFIIGSPVYAGPPIAYDSWSESAGVITASCPTGFNCQGDSSDQGMMQRILYDSNGDQYIHQVITEFTADEGNMTLETFVFSSNGEADSGIASKQHLYHNQTDKNLDVMIYLNTGWANTGENVVEISQYKDTTTNGNSNIFYTDSFTYYERRDTTTQEINGTYVDLTQGQLGSTYFQSDGAIVTTQTDQYSFVNRQASGVFNPIATVASLTNYWSGSTLNANGATGGGTVAWDPGDAVRMIWWGQYCSGCSGYSANMSLQVLENMTTSSITAGQRYGVNAPMSWPNPPFGDTPGIIQY